MNDSKPLPEPKAWSFRYTGPIGLVDDRSCDMCNAAGAKKCPKDASRHGQTGPGSCPTCMAARTGLCPNHMGISRALQAHTAEMGHEIHAEQSASFEEASRFVLALTGSLPPGVSSIVVRAHGNQDQPDMPFAAATIEIVAHK